MAVCIYIYICYFFNRAPWENSVKFIHVYINMVCSLIILEIKETKLSNDNIADHENLNEDYKNGDGSNNTIIKNKKGW